MVIQGLQKTTLLDFPGKVACTVFTGGCNFRCPFCHNAGLLGGKGDTIPLSEVMTFLQKRSGLLDGICVTGGEPLLQNALEGFLAQVKALGYAVKLDTNGSRPKRLRELIESGLVDMVAMDIKNAPARYAETVGIPGYDPSPVLESAALLMKGNIPYEFRTTVVKELHTRENFVAIGEWLKGAERYFLQGFEDSGNVLKEGLHPHTAEEMQELQKILLPYIPNAQLRGID